MQQEIIDVIRVVHLACFAVGMGSGVYFDFRTLSRLNSPFDDFDILEFERVHKVVFAALLGLWITGVMLIYIRTGFDLDNFSPKLILKLAVVTVLTLNAFYIGLSVLPRVAAAVGHRACELPLRYMMPMTFAAALSMFCWLGGLILGASVVLKTADWTMLVTFFSWQFIIVVVGAIAGFVALRASLQLYNILLTHRMNRRTDAAIFQNR